MLGKFLVGFISFFFLSLTACQISTSYHDNILVQRSPTFSVGVKNSDLIANDKTAAISSFWTDQTAIFKNSKAFVAYDLGKTITISSAWILADNDDSYIVESSIDGLNYKKIWEASPESHNGLQARAAKDLAVDARFIRLKASGGDSNYSVGELRIFEQYHYFPELLTLAQRVNSTTLNFAAAVALLLFALTKRSLGKYRFFITVAVSILVLFTAAALATQIAAAWPLTPQSKSLIRAISAGLALLALVTEKRCHSVMAVRTNSLVLLMSAIIAVLSFYNLGTPQFTDHRNNRKTYIHYLDLRQYYATAKYHTELGYSYMFAADVAAYLQDNPNVSLESISKRPMRNLSTHLYSTIGAQAEEIRSVSNRFSLKRWEEYKLDQRWFRAIMGTEAYFIYMMDYGSNATPFWLAILQLLYRWGSPSDTLFECAALADVALLMGMFIAIGYAYGRKTMLVAMTVFGATDFYMYGSNWAGAPLRHDWLAYLGIGFSMLRLRRYYIAGVFLALSTMIRAFPASVFLGLGLSAIVTNFVNQQHSSQYRLKTFIANNLWLKQTIIGAFAAALTCFLLSLVLIDGSAWLHWLHKLGLLADEPHVSHFGLRSLLAGWDNVQSELLANRRVTHFLLAGSIVYMMANAMRGRDHANGAILGLFLVPAFMYASNYYLHLICLFPLLTAQESSGQRAKSGDHVVGSIWLTLCALQYFTVLEPTLPLHFYFANVLLFVAVIATLLYLTLGRFNRNA